MTGVKQAIDNRLMAFANSKGEGVKARVER